MDDYKKIPFDDPDLCVPDLDDFDQMKEFFLDCAAEYFRYQSTYQPNRSERTREHHNKRDPLRQ